MDPFQFQFAYHLLGVNSTATEAEIRTAYHALALITHPDKANAADREAATARFQELNAAYEACLQAVSQTNPDPNPWGFYSETDDYEDSNSSQNNPPGQTPMAGLAWWDRITAEHPLPLQAWAKACKKAHRNSRRPMTEMQRALLNAQFTKASEKYEAWRREEELERQERAAQWRKEAELNEREYKNMSFYLEQKKKADQKKGFDSQDAGYDSDLNEDDYFDDWEAQDLDRGPIKAPTGNWRDRTSNKSEVKRLNGLTGSDNRLENFQRQIRALDTRNTATVAELTGQDREAKTIMRRKAKARNATEAKLQKDVHEELSIIAERKVQKKLAIAAGQAAKKAKVVDYWEDDIDGASDG